MQTTTTLEQMVTAYLLSAVSIQHTQQKEVLSYTHRQKFTDTLAAHNKNSMAS